MTETEAQIIADAFQYFTEQICDYMTEKGRWCEIHCEWATWQPECLLRYVRLMKKELKQIDEST